MTVFQLFYEMKLKTFKFKVLAFWSQQRYHDQIQITGFSYQKNQILKSWWEWQPSLPHSCILLHKQATHWPPTPNNLGPSVIISMLALFCRGLKLVIRAYWLFDPPEHFFQFSPLHFEKDRPIIKFIYSEKATKFCEIFTLLLSYVVPVKVRWRFRKILWPSQNIWTLITWFACRLLNKANTYFFLNFSSNY